MKLGLINSAWFGSPVGTAEGIRLTKEIGFDTIDIFADPLEIGAQERRLIRDSCREAGLPVISVVCVALGIADFNGPVRRFHVERAKRFLDLGYELYARNLLLVLGEYTWQQEVIAPRDQWNWAVECVRELGAYAAGMGLEVAIELEPFEILSIIKTVLADTGFEEAAMAVSEHHFERKLKRCRVEVIPGRLDGLSDAEELYAHYSDQPRSKWDKSLIVEYLVAKHRLHRQTARAIASMVEEKVFNLGLPVVPAGLEVIPKPSEGG